MDLSFQTTEVYSIISALAISVIFFICSNRYFLKQLKSFEFNLNYFLLGFILSILSAFVFFNWETQAIKEYVIIEDSLPEESTIPVTIWKPEKVKLPPPPKETKIEIKKEVKVFKIKTVKKLETVIEPRKDETEVENKNFNFDSMMVATKTPILAPIEETVEPPIVIAEQMPRFPGCEDLEMTATDKYQCSKKELLEYIYENLDYPRLAIENNIKGTVVLQFVVDKDGSISDINVRRDIGGGCGRAAAKVVESMNSMPTKWKPGRMMGKPVRVLFTLPVKFHIE